MISILTTIAAVVLLLVFWKGPNAVWGTATLGVVIGIIGALITRDWYFLLNCFKGGVFLGTFFELLGRWASKFKK